MVESRPRILGRRVGVVAGILVQMAGLAMVWGNLPDEVAGGILKVLWLQVVLVLLFHSLMLYFKSAEGSFRSYSRRVWTAYFFHIVRINLPIYLLLSAFVVSIFLHGEWILSFLYVVIFVLVFLNKLHPLKQTKR